MTDKLSPEELTQVIIMRAVTKLSAEQIEEILEALNGEA